ncbi:MAG: dihydroorotate dehydrogenase-like protein [Mediterranea sp.]|jgi:dihydroorotate dehydrogenase (fumarate)|nr:dihydroorotate dehydrogenase-like protein [Mediterranea sp.]
MNALKTTFAGLKLNNPIIISSSSLTDSVEKNKKLAEAGVGAIVLKSLFEEQIMLEADWLGDPSMYPEGSDYLVEYVRQHKLSEYLMLIKESVAACNVPIIASINCYHDAEWVEFATQIEEAGAAALEINILALQTDVQYKYGAFEQHHIDILRNIKQKVRIPIIMKLGDNLTNPVALIDQLRANGAAGVVLFNRFYQPDIDIERLKQSSGNVLSSEADLSRSLRWVGIASAAVKGVDYAVSGGVHSLGGVVKAILAGASAVEMCSVFYKQDANSLMTEYLTFLKQWMGRHGMESIEQFKGMLNVHDLKGINTFERAQFMKYFSSKEVFNNISHTY